MVISLDAEKALNRVLHKFNLGDNFIKWVKLLYKSPMAAVITNGYRSDNFPLHRSTRQGYPLSPTLFALAIEPLAEAIRQDPEIIDLNVGGIQHKISLYTNGVLLYVQEPETSVSRLVDVIIMFCVFLVIKSISQNLWQCQWEALETELTHCRHSRLDGQSQVLSIWALTLLLCFRKCLKLILTPS